MNAILNSIGGLFIDISREERSSRRARRTTRLNFGQGIEGLEERMFPSTVLVGVTVTNQPPTESPTTAPSPGPKPGAVATLPTNTPVLMA